MYLFYSMLYKECTTGYVICMYRIYSERKCIEGDFMYALRRFYRNIINISMMICVYLVLILSTCHTRVVLQGIIHVCNFFFNHNVYTMILHVFFLMGLWPFGYNENKLVKLVKLTCQTIKSTCYCQVIQYTGLAALRVSNVYNWM